MRKVAIFVDAGFFNRFFLPVIDPDMNCPASELAKKMWHYWIKHVNRSAGESLYRIFYYDCPPLENIAHHPITNRQIDFSKSDITRYMQALHAELLKQPFVACRMGRLQVDPKKDWGFIRTDNQAHSFKKLVRGEVDASLINPDYVSLRPRQKGVDMKIGVDIASVVLKKQAEKIVLISGDSDFVPASKLARMEGAHFILDAMGRKVQGELAEHIDQLKSFAHSFRNDDK